MAMINYIAITLIFGASGWLMWMFLMFWLIRTWRETQNQKERF